MFSSYFFIYLQIHSIRYMNERDQETRIQGYIRPLLKKFVLFMAKERGDSISKTLAHMIEEYQRNNPDLTNKFKQ